MSYWRIGLTVSDHSEQLAQAVIDSCVTWHSVVVDPGVRKKKVRWGDHVFEAEVVAKVPKPAQEAWLQTEIEAFPVLAGAANQGALSLYRSPELRWESANHGVPWFFDGPASPFSGIEIHSIPMPFEYSRLVASHLDQAGDADTRWHDFLNSLDHTRYLEILHGIGDNKKADALHLWATEVAGIEFFVTTDQKLSNSVRYPRRLALGTNVLSPTELLDKLERLGWNAHRHDS